LSIGGTLFQLMGVHFSNMGLLFLIVDVFIR